MALCALNWFTETGGEIGRKILFEFNMKNVQELLRMVQGEDHQFASVIEIGGLRECRWNMSPYVVYLRRGCG